MPEPQNRKLAAILFADIVGYTALMQSNEPKALATLQKFKTELEMKVPNYKGEIIQFYGDGCLAVFNSSVDAVICAKKLQVAFQSAPIVPVRIGLNAGDVVFKDENVFGDAVNIASRVESMGIPGAVLLSSNVRNQIKNQPELELVSLGKFEFKNVVEGMTVFALQGDKLAIPKQEEIKGKLKESLKNEPQRNWLWTVLLILAAAFFGLYQWYQPAQTTQFDKTILKERIAVLPFKNNTNNSDLDILGDMSSDWITRGLMRIEEAEVVSPNTIQQHLDAVGILPNNRSGKTAFSDLTGAKTVLKGAFYEEKGAVIFHLEITDALSGKLLHSFPPIRGTLSEKEKAIELIQEKVTGFWASKEEVLQKKFSAPNYEAYKLFLESRQEMWFEATAFKSYLKVLELDSNFHLARLEFVNNNLDAIISPNIPHLAFLERHKEEFSFFERKYFRFVKGRFKGDYLDAQKNIEELRKKYPKDLAINNAAGMNALTRLRNPKLAKEILETLDIRNYQPDKDGMFYFAWVHNYFHALYMLKDYQKAEDYYTSLPQAYKSNIHSYPLPYFFSLIRLGKGKQVLNLLKTRAENPQVEYNAFSVSTSLLARHFLVLNQPENMQEVSNVLTTIIQQNRTKIPFAPIFELSILQLTKQWEQCATVPYEHLASFPYFELILGMKGVAYIKTGQVDKVQVIFQLLDDYYEKHRNNQADINARTIYTKGMLYAQLGKKEKAVQLLKASLEQGIISNYVPFEFDPYLKPLEDYAPYEELLKPIEAPLAN